MGSISLPAYGNQIHAGTGRTAVSEQTKQWAETQFEMAYGKAKRTQFWAFLRHKEEELIALDAETAVYQTHSPTCQTIQLEKISGSECGKTADFDAQFLPLHQHSRDRWVSIAAAFKLNQHLPPIELLKIDDDYFVVDGHHRLSVAHWLGHDVITAYVTEASIS